MLMFITADGQLKTGKKIKQELKSLRGKNCDFLPPSILLWSSHQVMVAGGREPRAEQV